MKRGWLKKIARWAYNTFRMFLLKPWRDELKPQHCGIKILKTRPITEIGFSGRADIQASLHVQ